MRAPAPSHSGRRVGWRTVPPLLLLAAAVCVLLCPLAVLSQDLDLDELTRPKSLGLCQLVSKEKAPEVSCPRGTVVVSGGVDCAFKSLFRHNDVVFESAGAITMPMSVRTWRGVCHDNSGFPDATPDRWTVGTVWALCCPIPNELDGPEYETVNADRAKLPQWSNCYHRSADPTEPTYTTAYDNRNDGNGGSKLCDNPTTDDLVAAGLECIRVAGSDFDWTTQVSGTILRGILSADGASGRPAYFTGRCGEVNNHAFSPRPASRINSVCCTRNATWFGQGTATHASRAARPSTPTGATRRQKLWGLSGTSTVTRCQAANLGAPADNPVAGQSWIERGQCKLEPSFDNHLTFTTSPSANNAEQPLSHHVCGEQAIMVAASLDCERHAGQTDGNGQYRNLSISLNPDNPSYWRLNGICTKVGPTEIHTDSQYTYKTSAAAFCYPLTCGDIPAASSLQAVNTVTGAKSALQPMIGSQRATITCPPNRSFSALRPAVPNAPSETVERMCSEKDFTYDAPLPVCYPFMADVANGRLVSSWDAVEPTAAVQITVICDAGYAARGGISTLPASLTNPPVFVCQPIAVVTGALTATALSSWTYRAEWTPVAPSTWTPPADEQGTSASWFYELRFDLVWPSPSVLAQGGSELAGIRQGERAIIRVGGDLTTRTFIVDTDTEKQIPQILSGFAVRIANSEGEHGPWSSASDPVQLPCDCQATNGPSTLSLPALQQLSMEQLFNEGDEVGLTLQNLSPCVGSVRITRVDQPSQTFERAIQIIRSQSECPTVNNTGLQQVRFPLSNYTPGTSVQYAIERLPRKLAPSSALTETFRRPTSASLERGRRKFETFAANVGGTPNTQHANTALLNYWARVSGTVRTLFTNRSPQPVAISKAQVRIEIGLDTPSGWVRVAPTRTPAAPPILTDDDGRYSGMVQSDSNIDVLQLRVWVVDAGDRVTHDFIAPTASGTQIQKMVSHPAPSTVHYYEIDFADRNSMVVSGQVTLQPEDYRWKAFKDCGVEGAIIGVYLRDDVVQETGKQTYTPIQLTTITAPQRPIRVTSQTRTDGKWAIAVPIDTEIVLIATAGSGPGAHVFRQSIPFNSQTGGSTTTLDFHDLTKRTLRLRIYGGEVCKMDVGKVTPTFVYEGCGGRKATMEAWFDDKDWDPAVNPLWDDARDGFTGAPAVQWVMKAWDPIPRAWFQPLVPTTVPPSKQSDYIAAHRQEAHDFFDRMATVRLDVRNAPSANYSVVYRSPTQVQLVNRAGCVRGATTYRESSATSLVNPHRIFAEAYAIPDPPDNPADTADPPPTDPLTFRLFEVYGDQQCYQLEGDNRVFFHDFTIAQNDVSAPEYECFDGCQRLAVPRLVNPDRPRDAPGNWLYTQYQYAFRPTRVEWRESVKWLEDEENHVPYSLPLLYKSATSVLPAHVTHVIVTGDADQLEPPGALFSIKYPSIPLFILHAPPGSLSKTSLAQGDAIELEQQTFYAVQNGFGLDSKFGPRMGGKMCTGAGFCKETTKVGLSLNAHATAAAGHTRSKANTLSAGYTYEQEFSTAGGRVSDLSSSLVLLHTGILNLKESMRVWQMPAVGDDLSCSVYPPFPSLTWIDTEPAPDSFSWTSQWQIVNEILPQLHRTWDNIRDITRSPQPDPDTHGPDSDIAGGVGAIAAWEAILREFSASVTRAEPWRPSVHKASNGRFAAARSVLPSQDPISYGVGVPGFANAPGSASDTQLGLASDVTLPRRVDVDPQWSPHLSNVFPQATLAVPGAGQRRRWTQALPSPDFNIFATFVGVGKGMTTELMYKHHKGGSSADVGKSARTQKLTVTLGDDDAGDSFDVEIRIDPKYGAPVYIVKGGQSRCPNEEGTLSREGINAQMGDGQLTFVPPAGIARVSLILDNQSPTHEAFSYSVGVNPGDAQGLVIQTGAVPLVSRSIYQLVPWTTAAGLTKIPLEISRTPGSPYEYQNVTIAITPSQGGLIGTGDGSVTPGWNGGACPSDPYNTAYVTVNVEFQQECNRIEWSGLLKVMHQLTASSDPNTWNDAANVATDKLAGTPLSIRNPEFTNPARSWRRAATSRNGRPAQLKRVTLQYRRIGGDETDWLDMLNQDGHSPQPIDQSDPDSGLFNFNWRTQTGLDDGLYEMRAQTRCFMPEGSIDSALESVSTPIKRILVDHTPPTKLGEPTPGIALLYPETPLRATFTEPIQCLTPWSSLKVRAWIHKQCTPAFPACSINPYKAANINDPEPLVLTNQPRWTDFKKTTGVKVVLNTHCHDNVIDLAFLPGQSWAELQGELVTVMLWDIRDGAFNEMTEPLSWTFRVAHFDVDQSLSHVKGSSIDWAGKLPANDTAEYGQLRTTLQTELYSLIMNSLESAGIASADIVFDINQLQITNMRQGSIWYDFDVLPSLAEPMPGQRVLSPANITAAYLDALESGLFRQTERFSMLSDLRYTPASEQTDSTLALNTAPTIQVTVEAFLTPADEYANTQLELELNPGNQPPVNELPPPTSADFVLVDHTLTSGRTVQLKLSSASALAADGSAVMELRWHPVLSAADLATPPADLSELSRPTLLVRWRQLPDLVLDDLDEIGQEEELDWRSWTAPISTATAPASRLMHQAGDHFAHRLWVRSLPRIVHGREFEFEVSIAPNATVTVPRPPLFSLPLFVVGPPSAPVLLGSQQLTATNLSLSVRLSEFNGLSKRTLASRYVQSGVSYALSVVDSRQAEVVLSVRSFHFDTRAPQDGVTSLVVDLSTVNGLALPVPGAADNYRFSLQVHTSIAASEASGLSVSLGAVPASMRRPRTRQLTLDSYEVSAEVPASEGGVIVSFSSGYSFLNGADLNANAAANSTVRLSSNGRRVYMRVQFPLPHATYLPFHLFVTACNAIGCSAPVLHRVYPVFTSAPRFSHIEQLQVSGVLAGDQQAALLTWREPFEVSHPELSTGFMLRWMQGANVQVRRLGLDARAFNFTNLDPLLPLRVDLYAMMNHSSNYHVQRNPAGLHTIYSTPAAFTLTLRLPVAGPPIAAVTQMGEGAAVIRAQLPAERANEVEEYGSVLRCEPASAEWNGLALLQSHVALTAVGLNMTVALPAVSAGDALTMQLGTFSFSLAGESEVSVESGTERPFKLLGRPLPPLLTNISQSTVVAGKVQLTIEVKLPLLLTADKLHLTLLGAQDQPLASQLVALTASPSRLRTVVLSNVPIVTPLDTFSVLLSTSNVAGVSSVHRYTVTARNPTPVGLRFPPNCCSYRFRSPSVAMLELPSNPRNDHDLTPGNPLVHMSRLQQEVFWASDCDTTRIEYFSESARRWVATIAVTATTTRSLSSYFTVKWNGDLQFSADRDALTAFGLLTNQLFRMSASCRPVLSFNSESICFQFTLKAPVMDPALALQGPQPTVTCSTTAQADALYNRSFIQLPSQINSSVAIGASLVDINSGVDRAYNGSTGGSLCSLARSEALSAAAQPDRWVLPNAGFAAVTVFHSDEPLHPDPQITPINDDAAPTAPATSSSTAGQQTQTEPDPDFIEPDPSFPAEQPTNPAPTPSPTGSPAPVPASTAPAAAAAQPDGTGAGLVPTTPPAQAAASTGASQTSVQPVEEPSSDAASTLAAAPVTSTPTPSPSPALVFIVILRRLPAALLQSASTFLLNFRRELAAELSIPIDRLMILRGKKSAAAVGQRQQRQMRMAGASKETAASTESTDESAVELTVSLEPSASGSAASGLSSPSAMHQYLVTASSGFGGRSSSSVLSHVTAVGGSVEMPMQQCDDGTMHVSCTVPAAEQQQLTEAAISEDVTVSALHVSGYSAAPASNSASLGTGSSMLEVSVWILLGLSVSIVAILCYGMVLPRWRKRHDRTNKLSGSIKHSRAFVPVPLTSPSAASASALKLTAITMPTDDSAAIVGGHYKVGRVAESEVDEAVSDADVDVSAAVPHPLSPMSPGNAHLPRVRTASRPQVVCTWPPAASDLEAED